MANAAGFIQESIWRDDNWRKLSRSAQALYMQLLSQKELDCAGILPLQPNKWAKGCCELTVERVWSDLEELQRELFVFFDVETDETFIRTYIRNSNVIKVPNMMKSALRAALLVGSEIIKPLLAAELRATGRDDAIKVADQINPSETPPEPFRNGSKRNPSETLSEPTGVGVGVGVGVTSRSNHLQENSSLTLVEGGPGGDPPNLPVAAKAAPVDPRGKKIPEDWRPADETIASMRDQFPHLDLKAIHEEFMDYWRAIPGTRGRKTDWNATWRNRVREIASRQRPNGHARPGVGKPTQKAMGWEAAGNELLAEMERQ